MSTVASLSRSLDWPIPEGKQPSGLSEETPPAQNDICDLFLKRELIEAPLPSIELTSQHDAKEDHFALFCQELTQVNSMDQVLKTVCIIAPRLRASEICKGLIKVGKIDLAIEFANKYLSRRSEKEVAFYRICKALVNLSDFDKALQLAQKHLTGYDFINTLSTICKTLVKNSQTDKALEIAKTISPANEQHLISVISRGLAEIGDAIESMKAAYMILDELDRSLTFEYNSEQFVKMGRLDEALHMALLISNNYAKRRALVLIEHPLNKRARSLDRSEAQRAEDKTKAKELQSIIGTLPFVYQDARFPFY